MNKKKQEGRPSCFVYKKEKTLHLAASFLYAIKWPVRPYWNGGIWYKHTRGTEYR